MRVLDKYRRRKEGPYDISRKFQSVFDMNGLEQVQKEKGAGPSQNEIFSYQRQPVWHASSL